MLVDYLSGKIAIETLIILNNKTRMFDFWNQRIEEQIIWPSVYLKCTKYTPFVCYDEEKTTKILLEIPREVAHN
jgi:hypothetical protein